MPLSEKVPLTPLKMGLPHSPNFQQLSEPVGQKEDAREAIQ